MFSHHPSESLNEKASSNRDRVKLCWKTTTSSSARLSISFPRNCKKSNVASGSERTREKERDQRWVEIMHEISLGLDGALFEEKERFLPSHRDV